MLAKAVYEIVHAHPEGLRHAEIVREVLARGITKPVGRFVNTSDTLTEAVHKILARFVGVGAIARQEVDLTRRYRPRHYIAGYAARQMADVLEYAESDCAEGVLV